MKPPVQVELRRHLRLEVELTAQRTTEGGQVTERVLTLSASGLALATSTRLNLGAEEKLHVRARLAGFSSDEK